MPLSDLKFRVQNEVGTGVPAEAVALALKDAARDFCSDSESWIEKIESVIDKTVTVYSAVGLNAADVKRIHHVKLLHASEDTAMFHQAYPIFQGRHTFWIVDGNSIEYTGSYLEQYDGGTMQIESVLIPEFNSDDLPEAFIQKNSAGLIAGACMKLAVQRGRPWADANLYQLHKAEYEKYVTRAINSVMDGKIKARM